MNLRIRVIICLCILSFLLSLVFLTGKVSELVHDPEYTVYTHGVATTNGVYFCENWNNNGWIYNMEFSGRVKDMMSSSEVYESDIHDIAVADGKVYGLFSAVISDETDVARIYNIVELDEKLNPKRQIDDILLPVAERPMEFAKEGDYFYITAVETDEVNVYKIDAAGMKDVKLTPVLDGTRNEKKISEMEEPDSVFYKKVENNSVIVDAIYSEGTLSIRTDREPPTGAFIPDSRVKDAVDEIRFGFFQNIELYGNYVVYWIGVLIIWLILILLLNQALKLRNRVVYLIFTMEVSLLIMITTAFYFVKTRYRDATRDEATRFAILSLEGEMDSLGNIDNVDFSDKGFYESQTYANLFSSLERFSERSGNFLIFNDVLLVRIRDCMTLVDSGGYNGESIERRFGRRSLELIQNLKESRQGYANKIIYIRGSENLLVGVADDDLANHQYALVGLIASDDPFSVLWDDENRMLFILALNFLVCSLIIILILLYQHSDIRSFEKEIREVALGRTKVKVPSTPAQDMRSMWNSLSEIGKRIEGVNYDRFRIFEAYYRFAPKDIETIMDKDSIFDVQNGDITQSEGTIMLVSTEKHGYGEGRLKALRNVVSYMDNYVDDKEGILVSHDSSLSLLEFLFISGSGNTVSKAVQFLHRNDTDTEADRVSIFLYITPFTYGIVGINDKSLTFLTSENAREIESYAEWFEEKKIPLVITEWVREKEKPEHVRFIGYIYLGYEGSARRVDLYEVLDACSARMRQLKMSYKEKFEETIQDFYDQDFYIARNKFTEILKECPEDEMVRWYLFESEKYLNEGVDVDDFAAIRL